MRKFQVGDVVQIVNHQRLPWRLDKYRRNSLVDFIEIIERTEWAVPAFLEKVQVEEPFTFEDELMALLGGAAV